MPTRRDASGLVALAALVLLAACKHRPEREKTNTAPSAASAGDTKPIEDAGREMSQLPRDSGTSGGAAYRSASGGFEIRFPEGKAPEVEEKAITCGRGAVHLFKVQYGTSGYIVSYDDFTRGGRASDIVLDGARDGLVGTTGGTIDSERPFTLDGHPGRDLAVTATTSGITMRQRVRVLLVDGRLYQMVVVAPSWSGAVGVEQEFFDSFRLLNDAGR